MDGWRLSYTEQLTTFVHAQESSQLLLCLVTDPASAFPHRTQAWRRPGDSARQSWQPFACQGHLKTLRIKLSYYVTLPGRTAPSLYRAAVQSVTQLHCRHTLELDRPCLVLHLRGQWEFQDCYDNCFKFFLLLFQKKKNFFAREIAHDVSGAGPSTT